MDAASTNTAKHFEKKGWFRQKLIAGGMNYATVDRGRQHNQKHGCAVS
jgi:hypothetical protein